MCLEPFNTWIKIVGGSHNLHSPSPILQGYAYAKNLLQFSYSTNTTNSRVYETDYYFLYLFNPFILNDTKDMFSLGPVCDKNLTLT